MRILKTGMKMGDLILRRKLKGSAKDSPAIRKKWIVECTCGAPDCFGTFTVPDMYLKRRDNPKVTCGAKFRTNKTRFNEEYRIWLMMHVRTEDPNHVSYKDYGGRGIRVCAEWHKSNPDGLGFDRFLEYVGPRPSPGHSIDRVDNDQGYQPYHNGKPQVRWATATEQRANQRTAK